MWCKYGHVSPKISGSTRAWCSTVWQVTVQPNEVGFVIGKGGAQVNPKPETLDPNS